MSQISTFNLPEGEAAKPEAKPTIPVKFLKADGSVDVEGMAKSYAELERKSSAPAAKPAAAPATDELDAAFAQASAPSADLWTAAQSEIANEGKISQETRDSLKKSHRVTDDVIDSMVAGAVAQKALVGQRLADAAGGVENLNAAIAHAAATRTPEQLKELRASLKTNVGPMVLKGLMAEMGTKPVTNSNSGAASFNEVSPSVPANSVQPYADHREMLADFQSRKYQTDPKFRESAVRRMAATQLITRKAK